MVGHGLKQTMLFVLGIVAIIFVCRYQLGEYPSEQYERIMSRKRAAYELEITPAEISSFARLWPEFKQLGLDKDFNVSYMALLPSEAADWKRKLWFRYHHWDADRFFYVQQRIGYLLQALEIRRDAQNIIDSLDGRYDELAEQLRELQRMRIKSATMSFAELLAVSTRENQLRELLK